MNQVRNKSLELALTCIKAILGIDNNDLKDRFKTRCRQELERLYYNGLMYELAYILSKASDDNSSGYDKLKDILMSKDFNIVTKVTNIGSSIHEKNESVYERKSYELYGACLVWAIRELGIADGVNDLLILFDKLNVPSAEELVIDKVLAFAEWLKRLAEATIKG